MAGAFIGIADDYSAVYWNPAGITQMKSPQVGIFVSVLMPMGTYKLNFSIPGMLNYNIDAKTKSNHYISPNIAGYMPLLNGDLTVGLGVYVPSGIGAEWDGADLKDFNQFDTAQYNWMGKVGVFYFSPVVAYQINEMFSVGAAANISYGMFDMKKPVDADGNGKMDSQYDESSTGIGFSASVGVMVKPVDMLSIGLSFKTENKIAFEGTAKNTALQAANALESEFKRDVAWPLWFGGGVAVKPFKGLTIAVDVDWSQWSKTENEIVTDYENNTWRQALSEDSKKLKMHWKDCMQIRGGVQYEVDECIAVRCGFYTDPAPAPDETLNIIFPSISYNAVCIGGSYKFSSFNVDLGLEYLMGQDRTIPFPTTQADQLKYKDAMPGTHGMNIFSVSLGVSYTIGE